MTHRVAWFAPFPLNGSGGHRTIYSHILNLAKQGYDCHIYIGEGGNKSEMQPEVLRRLIEKYYGIHFTNKIFAGYETNESFDMAIATAWWTAPIVANKIKATHKAYFIQDFEPCFNPLGDGYILAENTYKLGLIPITIGRYLTNMMSTTYETPAHYFDFSADLGIYKRLESIKKELAICFVYQPEKPRRCPIIGREALSIVKFNRPETTIYTYGTDEIPSFGFDHEHLGLLSLKKCNELYNKCTVGLCLSSSNPSRIPFEMMASGLPVVDFYGENTVYDMPREGVLLAERDPSSLAGAMIQILDNQELQNNMQRKGEEYMHNKNSNLEFEQFSQIIKEILTGNAKPVKELAPLYTSVGFSYTFPPESIPDNKSVPPRHSLSKRIKNRLRKALRVLVKGYY